MSSKGGSQGASAGLFGQLSDRERRLLALAGAGVLFFVGSLAWSGVSSAMEEREAIIEDKEQSLAQVAHLAGNYAENERRRRDLEGRLAGPALPLLGHMQELCDKHHITIRQLSDRKSTTTGDVTEAVVELSGGAGNITDLTALLNELERNPRIIKVKKMRASTTGPAESRSINFTLTVATYATAGKQG